MLRWLRSTVRGELSVAGLEARRRGGALAYALIDQAEALDDDDRGSRLFRVCAWNAFALQTIADTLIETDAKQNPPTAGYVPASTLRFATACVDAVPGGRGPAAITGPLAAPLDPKGCAPTAPTRAARSLPPALS